MRRRYITVDVFTDQVFGGNPLAVVLDAEGLSTAQMHAIAREFNYSETSFVLPPSDPAHTARVRIFTPRSELPFAGHPNVGTAYVLARGRAPDRPSGFVFEEIAGLIPLAILRDAEAVVGAEFQAPAALSRLTTVSSDAAAACLSLEPSEISQIAHAPEVVSVGLPFLVVELASREALSRAQPDLSAHRSILPAIGTDGIYAYVRERAPSGGEPAVIHARMFSPLDGIVEDPATGSATAAALGLLASIDAEGPVERRWTVHQGDDMGRPSRLQGRTVSGEDGSVAVHVGGRCAPVFEGVIDL